MLGLGWAYSMAPHPLKETMAGFLVTVVAGGMLTYAAGWHAAGTRPDIDLLLFGPAMSLWMGLAGSTKDLSDTDGDRLAGRRTWPVILGDRAARAVMALCALALGAGFLVVASRLATDLVPVAALVLVGAVALAALLGLGPRGADRGTRRRPYRAFMLTQYVAHLALVGLLALQL
jgi:4-hydroxybenzoate polyprenyltransferase